jgi:ABC-type bacteriocin/lantibiotic exporter with double-glycine peptidase domain
VFELIDVRAERGGRPVLRGLTTTLPEGVTAITGSSGSGKSTLLRLLNRLADPQGGIVRFRGRDVRELDVLALRRTVGLVPQLPALTDGSVADCVLTGVRLAGRREPAVAGLLERVGLPAELGGRPVAALSVGQQQRVMLARALALEPAALLLDEPTSALDPASRDAVEGTLRTLGIPLVLVTHDLAQADRLADHRLNL